MAKVGRPTKYDPAFCEEILLYFSVKPYRRKTEPVFDDDGDELEQKETKEVLVSDFPSFAGFAAQIEVDRDTLNEWCKVHAEFSVAYKKAKEFQENWILVNGMAGNINTAFGIFIAKNVTDMRDNREITLQGGDKPIQVKSIDVNTRIKQLKGEVEE